MTLNGELDKKKHHCDWAKDQSSVLATFVHAYAVTSAQHPLASNCDLFNERKLCQSLSTNSRKLDLQTSVYARISHLSTQMFLSCHLKSPTPLDFLEKERVFISYMSSHFSLSICRSAA